MPNLLRTNQAERRILRKPRRVVDILIAREAAVDRLAQQVRQPELRVLPASRVHRVLGDQFAERWNQHE
jgi:hypothetical protein